MAHIDELIRSATWTAARQRADGPRVLLATSMGGFNHGAMTDKALAIALTLRGARVDVFLCDGAPSCHLTKIGKENPTRVIETDQRIRCPACVNIGQGLFDPLGLTVHQLSRFLTPGDREEADRIAATIDVGALKAFTLNDWRIGEHALAGALRYFARGDLTQEPHGEGVARKFVKSAVLTARAFDQLLEQGHYDVVSANHGIYTPQGVIGEVARARGVRIVNWNPAYRKSCFIFSHGDSYHHTMISEDVRVWESLEMTPARQETITGYLRDRRQAKGDWIWFNNASDSSLNEIKAKLDLDDRPIILALTSVIWDACLHYESNAFESITDWMFKTVDYFRIRPDLQLVIRVHPAEVTGFVKSRARMAELIATKFPELPENIKIVPPDDPLSTYSLIDHANAVIVYSTKTGIEASAQGSRVIVAGEAWIRNKGFTDDAASPDSYYRLLDQLPFKEQLSDDKRERALRYAHHFFFRRMLPLPFLKDVGPADLEIDVDVLEALGPGYYPGLDCVCDGVLTGAPCVHESGPDTGPADGEEAAMPTLSQTTTTVRA